MATVHVSPGAYFKTTDLSAYSQNLTESACGIIGKFRKGPTVPSIITDTQTFLDVYGYPEEGMYSALAALFYLQEGNQLYIRRLTGANARKSTAEIPAGSVVQAEQILTCDGEDYQFHFALDYAPLPGTIILRIGSNTFHDNGFGKIIGGATSLYCNYIDYNTSQFRFTLATAPEEDEKVSIHYNGKLFVVTNELIGRVSSPGTMFVNCLARTGLYFPEEDTYIEIRVGGSNRILRGNTLNADNKIVVRTPEGSGSSLSDVGLIDPDTGEVTLTFDSSSPVPEGTEIRIDYDTFTESSTVVGIGDGITRAFSGYLNTRVSPGTSSIWVGDELISEDKTDGTYVGTGLVYSDNSVDYTTGTVKMALTFEPPSGTQITATYSTKAQSILKVFDSENSPRSFEGQIDVFPVVKGSVEVIIDDIYLEDDGEGYLSGTGGNGTIDYATGKVKINLLTLPEIGVAAMAHYLAKYGEMQALYEGEYGDGYKGKFSYLPETGYRLEVWTQNQDPLKDPCEESWNNIDPVNVGTVSYITNKATSVHVEIVPNVLDVKVEPLLGTIFTTTGGKSDIDSVSEEEVLEAIEEFENSENYDVNILVAPDFPGNKAVSTKLNTVCANRGECITSIDTPRGLTPRQAIDWSNGESNWNGTSKFNSSFSAIYYPWVRVNNPITGTLVTVPPSTIIPAVYAYNDNLAGAWFAPAGVVRGQVSNAVGVERALTIEERNLLYGSPNVINPIIAMPTRGIVVWGQKTTQRKATALDRINVRRLLNYISKVLATAFMDLIFEPNDIIMWTKYKQTVTPILERIQTKRGLNSLYIVCDGSLNTPKVVEQNEMRAKIYLQPTKTTERIETEFILTRQGVTYITED